MATPIIALASALRPESRFAALRRRFASPKDVAMITDQPDETGHTRMLLSQMRPGEYGHILSICDGCDARQHLMELGFVPGSEIEFIRVAPLGDPLTVRVRGYQLSLRRREADAVWVRRCPPETDGYAQGE